MTPRETPQRSSENTRVDRVALISPPWPLFNRPSIQIGALKAFLEKTFPWLGIDAHHLFLHVAHLVGYPEYRQVADHAWLGEAVFGALLFPDRKDPIEAMFIREAKRVGLNKNLRFGDLVDSASKAADRYLFVIDWDRYDLAGLSVCLCQFTSGLYFAKRIKMKRPELPIVLGGSMVAGPTGADLLNVCPDIDFIIQGEGELPLAELIRLIGSNSPLDNWPDVPGLLIDAEKNPDGVAEFGQSNDLDELPPPDFDDYFHMLNRFPEEKHFFPVLPAEMSRGCWWSAGKHKGCAFCNLNRQWSGYRAKTPDRVSLEFTDMVNRYKSLKIAFMDNLLPVKHSEKYLEGLKKENLDPDLFGEIRATTPHQTLAKMKAAGFRDVQIGVEALATSLLKNMNKGTTAVQNLEVMKNCEELGLIANANLILFFPGGDSEDVRETLRVIEYALPFRPLTPVEFWLGPGCPISGNQGDFGISAVFNHKNFKVIFPPDLERSIRYCVRGYRGGQKKQRTLWKPVQKALKAWENEYKKLHQNPNSMPILSYRDGGGFLIITRRHAGGEPMNHRLMGMSRDIYLFCSKTRSMDAIGRRFPKIPEKEVIGFLNVMTGKKLMFEEDGKFLALAVRGGKN